VHQFWFSAPFIFKVWSPNKINREREMDEWRWPHKNINTATLVLTNINNSKNTTNKTQVDENAKKQQHVRLALPECA